MTVIILARHSTIYYIQGMGFILSRGGGAEEWDLLGTGDIKIVAVSHAVLAEDYRGGAAPGCAQL